MRTPRTFPLVLGCIAGLAACNKSEPVGAGGRYALTPAGKQLFVANSDIAFNTEMAIDAGSSILKDAANSRFVVVDDKSEFGMTFNCTKGCMPLEADHQLFCSGGDICGSVVGYSMYNLDAGQRLTEAELGSRQVVDLYPLRTPGFNIGSCEMKPAIRQAGQRLQEKLFTSKGLAIPSPYASLGNDYMWVRAAAGGFNIKMIVPKASFPQIKDLQKFFADCSCSGGSGSCPEKCSLGLCMCTNRCGKGVGCK